MMLARWPSRNFSSFVMRFHFAHRGEFPTMARPIGGFGGSAGGMIVLAHRDVRL